MDFTVNLIKVPPLSKMDGLAVFELMINAIHVAGDYWIMEGDYTTLRTEVALVAEGITEGTGDMDTDALCAHCEEIFGIDLRAEPPAWKMLSESQMTHMGVENTNRRPGMIRATKENIDTLFVGVMLSHTDSDGSTRRTPGWRCRNCSWTFGTENLPPPHQCMPKVWELAMAAALLLWRLHRAGTDSFVGQDGWTERAAMIIAAEIRDVLRHPNELPNWIENQLVG